MSVETEETDGRGDLYRNVGKETVARAVSVAIQTETNRIQKPAILIDAILRIDGCVSEIASHAPDLLACEKREPGPVRDGLALQTPVVRPLIQFHMDVVDNLSLRNLENDCLAEG